MKRRQFITLLGGAATAWPRGAWAQQGERVRRIGVLMGYDENDPEAQARLAAFKNGLATLGLAEGRNLRIDLRWAAGRLLSSAPRRAGGAFRAAHRALFNLRAGALVAGIDD